MVRDLGNARIWSTTFEPAGQSSNLSDLSDFPLLHLAPDPDHFHRGYIDQYEIRLAIGSLGRFDRDHFGMHLDYPFHNPTCDFFTRLFWHESQVHLVRIDPGIDQ